MPGRKQGNKVAPIKKSAPPKTVKAVVIPLEDAEVIRDALKEAPHRYAVPALNILRNAPTADVPWKD